MLQISSRVTVTHLSTISYNNITLTFLLAGTQHAWSLVKAGQRRAVLRVSPLTAAAAQEACLVVMGVGVGHAHVHPRGNTHG